MLFNKRFGSVMLVLGLAAVMLFTMTASPSLAEKPIKIGMIDCYTGGAAAFTKPALTAWKMVIDEFNAKGGLNGRQIELVIRDDKFKPDEALSYARELVLKDNVDFLAGTTNSASALAVSEYAKQKKKLFIIHISRSDRITGEKGHRYVFRGCPSADIEGLAGGEYAATMPFKKWYIIGEDYEYGHSIADNFWKGLKKNRPDVEKIGEAWPKVGETDYSPYMTALAGAKPDAVYVAFGASGLLPFSKQAKLFGLTEKFPLFAFAFADSIIPMILKSDMPTGIFGGSNYLWYYPNTPENKSFVAKYLEYTTKLGSPDKYPSGVGVFAGYCCAKFLTDAILKAGTTDTEKVVSAMEGLSIDTPIGKIVMRACDHQAATPAFWGKVEQVEGFPFPVIKDVVATSPEKTMPSCEEIEKERKKEK